MSKFYLYLWFTWMFRVTICSVVMASVLSSLITFYIYINLGLPSINDEISKALFDLFQFWFPLVWSFTLLLALFRSLKYIFNYCISGYSFSLYTCDMNEKLKVIGYGDLVKVWRKWFMLIIWLVGALMILALLMTYLFSSYSGVFEWFNIYWLFAFILISGYFSFIILGARCKKVKVEKC